MTTQIIPQRRLALFPEDADFERLGGVNSDARCGEKTSCGVGTAALWWIFAVIHQSVQFRMVLYSLGW